MKFPGVVAVFLSTKMWLAWHNVSKKACDASLGEKTDLNLLGVWLILTMSSYIRILSSN